MHAPRRVPYRSLDDLGAVHRQIYGGLEASSSTALPPPPPSELALYTYHSPASVPVALGLTAALLSALSLPPSVGSLAKRLALASALVRLVNSLVDPLQQGLYARPVALLAAELGLPGWLVELRHAATHDDLPSVAVLVEAGREALAYLDKAYWRPTLDPPTRVDSAESWAAHTAILPGLLAAYKPLAKQVARDASTFPGPLKASLAELKAWVATPGDEARALAVLVDHLIDGERGLLVPLAKKKRPTFTTTSPHPPPALLATYTPLLLQLARAHPTLFPSLLARRLVGSLGNVSSTEPSTSSEPKARSRSDEDSRCAWLVWTIECLVLDSATGQDARPALVGQIAREAFGSGRPLRAVLAALAGRHPASLGVQLRAVLRVLGDINLNEAPAAADASMASADEAGPSMPLPVALFSTHASPDRTAFALTGVVSGAGRTLGTVSDSRAQTHSQRQQPTPTPSGTDAADMLRAAEAGWTLVPEQAWSVRPMGVRVGE